MNKKIFFSLILFMVIGEFMIRFVQNFESFSRLVKIPMEMSKTIEYNMLMENRIKITENNFRVMVIGDSYIAGAGLPFDSIFSQQLKSILQNEIKGYDDIFVLDVSCPGANTLDNNITYFQFVNTFKPNIVVWGYNYNDIWDNLEKKSNKIAALNKTDTERTPEINTRHNEKTIYLFVKRLFQVIHKSRLIEYTLKNIHKELKFRGIILPNTVMDLTLKSYSNDCDNWKKSKILLQEVSDDINMKNSHLIILKFQETNLLGHNELFTQTDKIIKSFFTRSPSVIYINGGELFSGEKGEDYFLSKYDGHPNGKAISKIAVAVSQAISTCIK